MRSLGSGWTEYCHDQVDEDGHRRACRAGTLAVTAAPPRAAFRYGIATYGGLSGDRRGIIGLGTTRDIDATVYDPAIIARITARYGYDIIICRPVTAAVLRARSADGWSGSPRWGISRVALIGFSCGDAGGSSRATSPLVCPSDRKEGRPRARLLELRRLPARQAGAVGDPVATAALGRGS